MDTATFSNLSVAEIEITYRNPIKPSQRAKITRSQDCYTYNLLVANWGNTIELYEDFYVLLLNNANRVMGLVKIGSGGVTGCVVDIKKVFSIALAAGSVSNLILAHNHPSGSFIASQADISITKKIVEAGNLFDIKVLDHLIVTSEGFLSFADEGMI
jgi:DNA repair protein RadC